MNMILQLRLKKTEGGLEKVLGVLRYRGYPLLQLVVHRSPDTFALEVTLTVANHRQDQHLVKHIKKIFYVETVEAYGEFPQMGFG